MIDCKTLNIELCPQCINGNNCWCTILDDYLTKHPTNYNDLILIMLNHAKRYDITNIKRCFTAVINANHPNISQHKLEKLLLLI